MGSSTDNGNPKHRISNINMPTSDEIMELPIIESKQNIQLEKEAEILLKDVKLLKKREGQKEDIPDKMEEEINVIPAQVKESEVSVEKEDFKNFAPSKSYWNNLEPGSIPKVIAELSQSKQQLISRIISFIKIIKLSTAFGQYSFRGQFAQDVFEITENLANMLPITANNAGIVVITESFENINVTRQFLISKQKVNDALYWLISNNPLYKDVTIDQNVVIGENDIIRVEEAPVEIAVEINEEPTGDASPYMEISDSSRIVRASWHQGNELIFTSGFAGVQFCAMALVNILRACILSFNLNMTIGDQIYSNIRFQTERSLTAHPIDDDQYLLILNFTAIQDNLVAFGKRFRISFDKEPSIHGSLNNKLNEANFGSTLCQGLEDLFMVHNAGILITDGQSFGVMHHDDKYYFSNSYSCDQKASRANDNNGKACLIECDNFDEFVRTIYS
ncbi:hypothetical protein RN001_014380 [Aquatica leii]|uniref:DUF6570 domain-containing protein n=1 Tax=Aquatica leii TaxID=1421715 RepID=A0AAN7NZG6_9COLE|nr:hypothetical protein RN001_014380 [Aquatica leii]